MSLVTSGTASFALLTTLRTSLSDDVSHRLGNIEVALQGLREVIVSVKIVIERGLVSDRERLVD